MPSITLHHFPPSAPSRSALLVARAARVPVNVNVVDLFKKEQLQPEFIKLNPQHTVPTLQDDDFVIWDSHAIGIYLVQSYASDDDATLYPTNPQQKALVDQRLYFNAGVLYQRIRNICFPVLFLGERLVSEEKKSSLEEALGWMDQFLAGRPWLAGVHLTVADCACAASLSSIIAVGYDISKHKKTYEWYERCKKEIVGFDENLEGAKQFGELVKSKLAPNQIN